MNHSIQREASHFVNELNRSKEPRFSREEKAELLEHQVNIVRLVKKTNDDIMEIGRRLSRARDIFRSKFTGREGDVQYRKWLSEIQRMSPINATTFIKIHKAFEGIEVNGNITKAALEELSHPTIPKEVREKAIEISRNGKRFDSCAAAQMALPYKSYANEIYEGRVKSKEKTIKLRSAINESIRSRLRQENEMWGEVGWIRYPTTHAFHVLDFGFMDRCINDHRSIRIIGEAVINMKMQNMDCYVVVDLIKNCRARFIAEELGIKFMEYSDFSSYEPRTDYGED